MDAIYQAKEEDAYLVGSILGQAFHDDPVYFYICGRQGLGQAIYPLAFRYIYAPLGHTYLIRDASGRPSGCAMWAGPGQSTRSIPWVGALRLTWSIFKCTGWSGMRRLLDLDRLSEEHHIQEPHYYLNAIGIDPAGQRQGLGGRLIQHVLKMADRDNVAAYLENSRERNLSFYQKHGFVVQTQIHSPPDGPPLWLMRRPRADER